MNPQKSAVHKKRGLDDGAGVGGCGGCRWIEGVRKKEIQEWKRRDQ